MAITDFAEHHRRISENAEWEVGTELQNIFSEIAVANPDKYPISSQGIKNADVNGKIGITPDDAICIQMLDAGLLPSLPVTF
jgi:hypothetical protein